MMDLSRVSLLVVEDGDHMRRLLMAVLRSFGLKRLEAVHGGREAVARMHTFVPDIIMTDWKMHDGDGLSLVRWLRTSDSSPNPMIPVIMVSAVADLDSVQLARDSGVNEYLAKPISARGLYSRLQSVILRPRVFVRAGDYFGPDRRRQTASRDADSAGRQSVGRQGLSAAGLTWEGRERRSTPPADQLSRTPSRAPPRTAGATPQIQPPIVLRAGALPSGAANPATLSP